ncbi:MAG TPA: hypothetical protein VNO23_15380, partial [Candidatus Binatia bacterium]|nr:hypothetical protein [Candidatus Binatia bacterium]
AAGALEQARSLARRRLAALHRDRPDRVAPRLRDVLRRRGFSPGVVEQVVREVVGAVADEPGGEAWSRRPRGDGGPRAQVQ